jgi:hypothetical protein
MNDIFKKIRKDPFTPKEKKEINEKMISVINIIQPLIKNNKNNILLKKISNSFLDNDNFLVLFNLGKKSKLKQQIIYADQKWMFIQ